MRIITPDDAAFAVGGPVDAPVAISYTFEGTATVDAVVAPFSIGTVAMDGPYLVSIWIKISNTTAATGTLAVSLVRGAYGLNSPATNLNATSDLSSTNGTSLLAGNVTLNWTIAGFTTGSADYKIIASIVKLF